MRDTADNPLPGGVKRSKHANGKKMKGKVVQHIHDHYLIVDDTVWLLGASVKDMGHGLCTVIKVGFTPGMVLGLLK